MQLPDFRIMFTEDIEGSASREDLSARKQSSRSLILSSMSSLCQMIWPKPTNGILPPASHSQCAGRQTHWPTRAFQTQRPGT
jgi:hypothetical protein